MGFVTGMAEWFYFLFKIIESYLILLAVQLNLPSSRPVHSVTSFSGLSISIHTLPGQSTQFQASIRTKRFVVTVDERCYL